MGPESTQAGSSRKISQPGQGVVEPSPWGTGAGGFTGGGLCEAAQSGIALLLLMFVPESPGVCTVLALGLHKWTGVLISCLVPPQALPAPGLWGDLEAGAQGRSQEAKQRISLDALIS